MSLGPTSRTLSTRKTFHNGRVARNLPKGSQGARRSNLNCQKISSNTRTEGVDAIHRPTILLITLRTNRQILVARGPKPPEPFQPERLSTMGVSPGTFQKDLKVPVGQTSIAKRFPATRALKVLLPFVGQPF